MKFLGNADEGAKREIVVFPASSDDETWGEAMALRAQVPGDELIAVETLSDPFGQLRGALEVASLDGRDIVMVMVPPDRPDLRGRVETVADDWNGQYPNRHDPRTFMVMPMPNWDAARSYLSGRIRKE